MTMRRFIFSGLKETIEDSFYSTVYRLVGDVYAKDEADARKRLTRRKVVISLLYKNRNMKRITRPCIVIKNKEVFYSGYWGRSPLAHRVS